MIVYIYMKINSISAIILFYCQNAILIMFKNFFFMFLTSYKYIFPSSTRLTFLSIKISSYKMLYFHFVRGFCVCHSNRALIFKQLIPYLVVYSKHTIFWCTSFLSLLSLIHFSIPAPTCKYWKVYQILYSCYQLTVPCDLRLHPMLPPHPDYFRIIL